MAKQKQPAFYFRQRTYAESDLCDVWLIERGSTGQSGLVHFVMDVERAEKMFKVLGIEPVREASGFELPDDVKESLPLFAGMTS